MIVKKRLMIDLWVGESLVDPPTTGKKTAENIADEILKELEVKGFIEPVKERRKLVANWCTVWLLCLPRMLGSLITILMGFQL